MIIFALEAFFGKQKQKILNVIQNILIHTSLKKSHLNFPLCNGANASFVSQKVHLELNYSDKILNFVSSRCSFETEWVVLRGEGGRVSTEISLPTKRFRLYFVSVKPSRKLNRKCARLVDS